MLTRRIIPCLDVAAGKVIRGVKFSADKVVGDPVELAAEYNRQGADELVFYDITASAEDRGLIVEVLERTADEVFIPLTVGGGISSTEQMRSLLRAGADKVSVNSQAVRNPSLIAEGADRFGSQCIVLSMDVLWNAADGFYEIVTHGGRNRTGMEVLAWATRGVELGAGELVVNSIDADGTKAGYELKLTRMVADAVGVPVVASGGAGALEHMYDVLAESGADAALAASIFHYGEFTIGDAKRYLASRGVAVRPGVMPPWVSMHDADASTIDAVFSEEKQPRRIAEWSLAARLSTREQDVFPHAKQISPLAAWPMPAAVSTRELEACGGRRHAAAGERAVSA